jgi:hypothetical protein
MATFRSTNRGPVRLFFSRLSLLLLVVFYLVVDVWRLRAGHIFTVIGSNSILIYMARNLSISTLRLIISSTGNQESDSTSHYFGPPPSCWSNG